MKVLLVALASVISLGAGAGPAIEIRDIAAEQPPQVHLVLRVVDASGAPIAGLTREDFQVFEDGTPVPELELRQSHPESEPVALSFLIDVSGSMTAADVAGARAGVLSVVERLAPEDVYEIVAFDSDIRVVKAFDQPLDRAAFDALAPGSDTKLNDAIIGAVDRLGAVAASERALVVLTDGVDDGSLTPAEAVVAKVDPTEIRVFSIGLGAVDSRFLETVSGATGGSFSRADDQAQLVGLYGAVASSLLTEYRISYASAAEPGSHDVNVVVAANGQSATVTQQFRLGPPAVDNEDEDSGGSSAGLIAGLGVLIAIGLCVLLVVLTRRSSRVPADRGPEAPVVAAVAPGTPVQSFHLVGQEGIFPISGRLVLGRDPLADLVVGDETVSRSHAQLEEHDGGVLVHDLGSSNGTRVNGEPISSHVARPGDRIAFGDLDFELRAPTA